MVVSLSYHCLFLAAFAASFSPSFAQTNSMVYASFAFINHAEHSPSLGRHTTMLTPRGARTMYAQGDLFRLRYLRPSRDDLSSSVTANRAIPDISQDAIDNSQLDLLAGQEPWVAAGAMAFMQGLYPPVSGEFTSSVGGRFIGYSVPDDRVIDYPLNGYQYPILSVPSVSDESSMFVQAPRLCPAILNAAHKNPYYKEDAENSRSFYKDLFSTATLKETISSSEANYDHAYDVFDYVRYHTYHNLTIANGLHKDLVWGTANGTIDSLLQLATKQQFSLYGNGSMFLFDLGQEDIARESGDDVSQNNSSADSGLSVMPGRTLLQKALQSLGASIESRGREKKLTLVFGTHEPLISFFELSGLRTRGSGRTVTSRAAVTGSDDLSLWNSLPSSGAALLFEIVGPTTDNNSFPSVDQLGVRTVYRSNAEPTTPFVEYGVWGYGTGPDRISWGNFRATLERNAVSTAKFCDMCQSEASFCQFAWQAESSLVSSGSHVLPAVAGIIGAAVTLGVFGFAALAAFFLGVRVVTKPRQPSDVKPDANEAETGESPASTT